MATERPRKLLSTLPVELKVQFGFTPDSSQKWIQSDNFDHVSIGGPEHGEWIPTRARALADGTRFEIGARRVDIEGLLELAKLIKPDVKGMDHVVGFWEGRPKVKLTEEDDFVFMGVDIPPTVEGFEQEFGAVTSAFDVALTAAIEGKSYVQMMQDKWHKHWVEDVEKDRQGGRTCIFREMFDDMEPAEGSTCRIRPQVTVDTLREFPIDTYETSVNFAPATVIRDGKSKEFKDIWLIAHNGRNQDVFNGDETVAIHINESTNNDETEKWEHDGLSLHLQIPDRIEVKTVEDMAKLTKAEVFTRDDLGDEEARRRTIDVKVSVEDDSIKVVSKDGSLSVEVRKPTCDECQIPVWKFRWPTEEEFAQDWDPYNREFRMHGANTSLGIYRCDMRTDEGTKTRCIDCAHTVEERYLQGHPFASKSRSIEIARRRLDETGYDDVEIWKDQVWRTESLRGIPGWEFFTKIEYQRDGRDITRYTGTPVLKDDGTFDLNMRPREYIDFRYKV